MRVNVDYDNVMPQRHFTDDEIADILTYGRDSWGNTGDAVSRDEVSKTRADTAAQWPAGAGK